MTKKEISELKKLYKKDGAVITRMCGCYVGDEKEKIAVFEESFHSLQEEETYKYFEIFKKTLSGNIGRNVLNLEFPTSSEFEGGTQEFLLRLRNSELKDEELLQQFYDRIINVYEMTGNYLILLIHNVYDVPGFTKDGLGLEDASEEVYSFLLCCICPVNLSKPGLGYYAEEQMFKNCPRAWVADMPESGFLFPAFNDRSTDLHSTLYYTKNPDNIHEELIDEILGAAPPIPVTSQKEIFHTLIEETLGESREYETIRNIQDTVQEKLEQSKENLEPLTLNKYNMKEILSDSGATDEQVEQFDEIYERVVPNEQPIIAANVINTRKFEVKTPNITVQVKPEYTHLLETKVVDGRKCLLIAIEDEVEVNGILVKGSLEEDN